MAGGGSKGRAIRPRVTWAGLAKERPPSAQGRGPFLNGHFGWRSAGHAAHQYGDGTTVLSPCLFVGAFRGRALLAVADRRDARSVAALARQIVLGGFGASIPPRAVELAGAGLVGR